MFLVQMCAGETCTVLLLLNQWKASQKHRKLFSSKKSEEERYRNKTEEVLHDTQWNVKKKKKFIVNFYYKSGAKEYFGDMSIKLFD